MAYRLIPEFSIRYSAFAVIDEKELAKTLDVALQASATSRVVVDVISDEQARGIIAVSEAAKNKKTRDIQAEADEFRKLAKQLGCADDPFSAWETVALLMKEKAP